MFLVLLPLLCYFNFYWGRGFTRYPYVGSSVGPGAAFFWTRIFAWNSHGIRFSNGNVRKMRHEEGKRHEEDKRAINNNLIGN